MKQELRNKYKQIRKNIKLKKLKDFIIFIKVITNKQIKQSNKILIYISTKEEIDTIKIIKYLINKKQIYAPVIENNEMNFYKIENLKDLKPNKYNILEPHKTHKLNSTKNAICITPGICFSKNKYRIGYGKGYYDKYFSQNKVYKIGLCYKKCLINNITLDSYDIIVDKLITS